MKLSDSHLRTSAILSRVAARKLVQVELRPLAATMERWYNSQHGATTTTHKSLIRVCSNTSKYYIQTRKDTKLLALSAMIRLSNEIQIYGLLTSTTSTKRIVVASAEGLFVISNA